ncbi:MAG: ribosome maturation factor RimP [Pseudomonadota bacterium]
MDKEAIQKIETIVSPILARLDFELLDLEWVFEGAQILRIYIDKQDGVSVADCVRVSHAIEDNLDAEGLITSRYRLEVSSPGLDRPLKRQKDFEKFQGHQIKVKTIEPIDGRSNYKGDLVKVDAERIGILIDGMVYEVPFDKILRARLVPDISKTRGQKK